MSAVMTPELAREAMDALHAEAAKAAEKYGITIDRLMKELNKELKAKETHAHFDGGKFGTNEWVYSRNLVAWKIRQEARRDAEAHLGIKPAEKHQHEVSGTFNVMAAVVDALAKLKAENDPSGSSR
jgi:hypothetical protein